MQAYVQWINPGINSTVQAFYQNPTIQVITTLRTEAAHAPTLQCMNCTRPMQVTCLHFQAGPCITAVPVLQPVCLRQATASLLHSGFRWAAGTLDSCAGFDWYCKHSFVLHPEEAPLQAAWPF